MVAQAGPNLQFLLSPCPLPNPLQALGRQASYIRFLLPLHSHLACPNFISLQRSSKNGPAPEPGRPLLLPPAVNTSLGQSPSSTLHYRLLLRGWPFFKPLMSQSPAKAELPVSRSCCCCCFSSKPCRRWRTPCLPLPCGRRLTAQLGHQAPAKRMGCAG